MRKVVSSYRLISSEVPGSSLSAIVGQNRIGGFIVLHIGEGFALVADPLHRLPRRERYDLRSQRLNWYTRRVRKVRGRCDLTRLPILGPLQQRGSLSLKEHIAQRKALD